MYFRAGISALKFSAPIKLRKRGYRSIVYDVFGGYPADIHNNDDYDTQDVSRRFTTNERAKFV